MDKKVTFQYFYGTQADQYSFYRIPKALFQDEYFRCLSSDAKILYGLMLDRMSLSMSFSPNVSIACLDARASSASM